ncbi:hypothetical protein NDU88_002131 [Pleurodeles waltl]|uniref:Uncharacterized protein n=1 Tax=Pleurodeles waltl TaxID=8319 RepID=A0AAV7WML8_PLEWA|nr:hypothetical protein NDU88_002131 [Pleurodeles waltl]
MGKTRCSHLGKLICQCPLEERDLESHHQEGVDTGGPQPTERPLSQEMGGPGTLGLEDCGGSAGAVLPEFGRDAHRTMTPLMACILVVAYVELDGHYRAAQQPQADEYTGNS